MFIKKISVINIYNFDEIFILNSDNYALLEYIIVANCYINSNLFINNIL